MWFLWFVSAFVYYGLVMVQPDMQAQVGAARTDHAGADREGQAVAQES